MDTKQLIIPTADRAPDFYERLVPVMNEVADSVDQIATKHSLTSEEAAHVVARLCEQLIESNK